MSNFKSIFIFSIFLFLNLNFSEYLFSKNEITIGVRGGVGISGNIQTSTYSGIMDLNNSYPDTSTGSTPIFSFHGGFMSGFMFKGSSYGFELQINYNRLGAYIKNEFTSEKNKLYSDILEIVVPFKMSLLALKVPSTDVHHPYLLFGPIFAFPLRTKIGNTDINDNVNKFNFGLLLGIGGRFRLKGRSIFFLEINFRAFINDFLNSRGKMRNYSIHFTIGYEIKLGDTAWD